MTIKGKEINFKADTRTGQKKFFAAMKKYSEIAAGGGDPYDAMEALLTECLGEAAVKELLSDDSLIGLVTTTNAFITACTNQANACLAELYAAAPPKRVSAAKK